MMSNETIRQHILDIADTDYLFDISRDLAVDELMEMFDKQAKLLIKQELKNILNNVEYIHADVITDKINKMED